MDNNGKVKNIWGRKNPFKKEVKIEEAEVAVEEKEEIIEEEIVEKEKGTAILIIQDSTVTVNDPVIKLDVSVRNKGTARAKDVKLKILSSPLIRPMTSPMLALGDMLPKDKKQSLVQFEMGQRFVDEYTNFSLMCESIDSKTASLVVTCKTGRKPLTATERLAQQEEALRKRLGGTKKK